MKISSSASSTASKLRRFFYKRDTCAGIASPAEMVQVNGQGELGDILARELLRQHSLHVVRATLAVLTMYQNDPHKLGTPVFRFLGFGSGSSG